MKRRMCMFLCMISCLLLIGCGGEYDGTKMSLYYANTDGNELVEVTYYRVMDSGEDAIKEVINELADSGNSREYQSVVPKDLTVDSFHLDKNELQLVFDERYSQMTRSTEVLLRAAFVQTLVQLPDVSYVSFYIGEEPLRDQSGEVVGLMCAEDFVQNTGSALKNFQTTDLTLYFASKDGTKLITENHSDVYYSINTSIEKLVVEQLMKGEVSEKSSKTIPSTVRLLGVSVKDGVCYVNFDSAFVNDKFNLKPEVVIYSIVNSIIANGNVTKVQIQVDGSCDVMFMGTFDLSEPLEWKVDLIEE